MTNAMAIPDRWRSATQVGGHCRRHSAGQHDTPNTNNTTTVARIATAAAPRIPPKPQPVNAAM
jgi:hypothetical protein